MKIEQEPLHTWVQQEMFGQLTWICQVCCHVSRDPSHVALREKCPSFMVGLCFSLSFWHGSRTLSWHPRTVLASNLHAKNGSERFSVMARYMLSILIDSCRTVVVVLAPVLPHNVVDVELLVPDVRLLRSCSLKHVWIFLCVVPGSLFSTSQKSPKTDDVMCCN